MISPDPFFSSDTPAAEEAGFSPSEDWPALWDELPQPAARQDKVRIQVSSILIFL